MAGKTATQDGLYYVDLQELELKAASAEAESERARRELAEAQEAAAIHVNQAHVPAGEEPNR